MVGKRKGIYFISSPPFRSWIERLQSLHSIFPKAQGHCPIQHATAAPLYMPSPRLLAYYISHASLSHALGMASLEVTTLLPSATPTTAAAAAAAALMGEAASVTYVQCMMEALHCSCPSCCHCSTAHQRSMDHKPPVTRSFLRTLSVTRSFEHPPLSHLPRRKSPQISCPPAWQAPCAPPNA